MSHPLYDLLQQLESARIHFMISRHRENTVLVSLTLVGQRIENDVFDDGHMEVSRFTGNEDILGGAEMIDELIAQDCG
jgi:hypothetical protein